MIQTFTDLVTNAQGLLLATSVLIVIAIVLITYFTTRSLPAVVGAVILAALVLFVVNNTDWLQQKATDDLGPGAAPAVSAITKVMV